MNKSFIIFLIVANIEIFTSSKLAKLMPDIEYNFDMNNYEFTFEYNGYEESAFYLVIIKANSGINFKCTCQSTSVKANITPIAFLLTLKKESCNLVINTFDDPEVNGTVMVHPLNIEINIDFNKKEKYELNGALVSNEKFPPIIYSLSNLEKDVSINFSYEKEEIKFDDKSFTIKNPFKICLKDDCKEKINTYKFLKGNNYKIYLMPQELKSDLSIRYQIPSFSFEIIKDDEQNN